MHTGHEPVFVFLRERRAEPSAAQPLARDRRIFSATAMGRLHAMNPAPRFCRQDPSVGAGVRRGRKKCAAPSSGRQIAVHVHNTPLREAPHGIPHHHGIMAPAEGSCPQSRGAGSLPQGRTLHRESRSFGRAKAVVNVQVRSGAPSGRQTARAQKQSGRWRIIRHRPPSFLRRNHPRGAIFQSSPLASSVTRYSAPSGPCRTSRMRCLRSASRCSSPVTRPFSITRRTSRFAFSAPTNRLPRHAGNALAV